MVVLIALNISVFICFSIEIWVVMTIVLLYELDVSWHINASGVLKQFRSNDTVSFSMNTLVVLKIELIIIVEPMVEGWLPRH